MTDPIMAANRAHAESLAAEHLHPSQGYALQEFLTFSVAVPEWREINGQRYRQINIGIGGNICYPE